MKKQVDAIVLAGGKGTRLAPLTEDTPKPMLKILGKTVLENVLDRISDAGIDKAVVTTMYLPWQIESIGTSRKGVKISYAREKEPLGTAGGAVNAYDGNADAVIILSGDGLYDFDLSKIINFHFEKNADVTIVTYSVENPLDFGVVLYDDDGRVTGFEEKPPWARVISGKVNTGIYVINREIMEEISKNCQYDFAKQLFPLLLAKNKQIFAYEPEGVWHDIGNLDGYFEATKSALDGKLRNFENDGFTSEELAEKGIDADSPFYVSRSAIVGTNVKIGAYTVIGANAVISDNCDISGSIISDGVKLGIGCGICASIIGRNTHLGENCISSEGCVIGANACAKDSIILPKYSFIHCGERINSFEFREKPCGKREKNLFTDEGINCDISEKSPEYIMRIGYAAAITASEKSSGGNVRIGIMTDNNITTMRIGRIILEGIRSCGVRSIDFGCGYEAQARFAAREFIADYVVYVCRNKNGHVYAKIFDTFGFPVSDSFERSFSNSFFLNSEYSPPDHFYESEHMTDINMLYYSFLMKEAKKRLNGDTLKGFVCAFGSVGNLRTDSPSYTAVCAITELGGSITRKPENVPVCFETDLSGIDSSCISDDTSFDSFHMNAALLSSMIPTQNEKRLYFSATMPHAYRVIAENNGFEINEYTSFSEKDPTNIGDACTEYPIFLEDAVFRTLFFAIYLHKSKKCLNAVSKKLPAFEVYQKNVSGVSDRACVMQRLSRITQTPSKSKSTDEGVRITLSTGSVTVIPDKLSGFRIISEAASMEAAKELCEEAEKYLK